MELLDAKNYLSGLKQRATKARVTKRFQLIGLEIAVALKDLPHKALYIKYAKELGEEKMLSLAKDIGERRDIKTPGAYFMKMVKTMRGEKEE